jgi:hypothetical protein
MNNSVHPPGLPDDQPTEREPAFRRPASAAPLIPDHTLLKRIGSGSYGDVWLARNATGSYRAVKVVYRATFDSDQPYEREFTGIKKFEPISRSHPSQVDVLHVGRNDAAGCATVEALRLNREHWQDLRWALRSVGCHPPAAG